MKNLSEDYKKLAQYEFLALSSTNCLFSTSELPKTVAVTSGHPNSATAKFKSLFSAFFEQEIAYSKKLCQTN